jgi:hypothetical protein
MRIFMLVQPPGARGPVGKHTSYLVAALLTWLHGRDAAVGPANGKRVAREMVAQRIRDVRSVRRTSIRDRMNSANRARVARSDPRW